MIPYGRQHIDESDIAAVVAALRSDYLTTGPLVEQFEQAFAEMVGAKHAVAVCNGTAALHLAMMVAGIGPGDRVVTSPITFLASANCAAYVGATPDFVDIDPVSYTLCPRSLEETWKPDTRAVVAVDFAGQTADMPAIAAIARRHGAIVIEDACHAIGGKFEHEGKIYSVGGHPWADIATFSFHPVKTMTTGEGGILVTNNDDYAAQARLLRTHGMTRDAATFVGLLGPQDPETLSLATQDSSLVEHGPWYYEMQSLGYNYRITDLQCALGLSQLKRLDAFVERRQTIVAQYNNAFADLPALQLPGLRNPADLARTSWHLYCLRINFASLGLSRSQFVHQLRIRGVGSQVHYIPVYLQPWYRNEFGYREGKCKLAEAFFEQCLSLPLYASMTDKDIQSVISSVRKVLGRSQPNELWDESR